MREITKSKAMTPLMSRSSTVGLAMAASSRDCTLRDLGGAAPACRLGSPHRVHHAALLKSYGWGEFICYGDTQATAFVRFDGERAERLVLTVNLKAEKALPLAVRERPFNIVYSASWP